MDRIVIPKEYEGKKVSTVLYNFFGDKYYDDNAKNKTVQVVLPDGITKIEPYAFNTPNRIKVNIPSSVSVIGEKALPKGLVLIENTTKPITWAENWINNENGSMPIVLWNVQNFSQTDDGLEYAVSNDNVYITGYQGDKNVIDIPVEIDGKNCLYIADYAFANVVNLQQVWLSKSVKEIGSYAFANCSSITVLALTDGLEKINSYAFINCENLKVVNIYLSVTYIGSQVFGGCDKLTIYTEHSSKPSNWASDWAVGRQEYISWGYVEPEYRL